MQAAKTLCVFVNSDEPDVYINVVGYCVEHFAIKRVLLISIIKDRGQKTGSERNLSDLRDRICRQLVLLQEGKYLYKDRTKNSWRHKEIEIQSHHRMKYAIIANQAIITQAVIYSELEQRLNDLLNEECIFDVSAILKAHLVDVFIVLQAKKVHDIYTFELRLKGRSYDEKELIHNLSLDSADYEYVNLAKSDCVKNKLVRTCEEDASIERSNALFENLLNLTIREFSRNAMICYCLFVLLLYAIGAIWVARADWNKIEPWTFIVFGLPVFPYLLGLLSQLIYEKEISFNPKKIYYCLKEYKKSRILRHLNARRIASE